MGGMAHTHVGGYLRRRVGGIANVVTYQNTSWGWHVHIEEAHDLTDLTWHGPRVQGGAHI